MVTDRFMRMLRRATRRAPRSAVPFVRATELADCGAASLAMVFGHFGRRETVAKLRSELGVGRDGASAKALIETGLRYGLTARAVSVPRAAWLDLPRASILHWRFNHFVVFDRFEGERAVLLDPSVGEIVVDKNEFGRSFSGVAVTFSTTERWRKSDVETAEERADRLRQNRWLRAMLSESSLLSKVLIATAISQLTALFSPALTELMMDEVLPRGDSSLLAVMAWGSVFVLAGVIALELVRAFYVGNLRVLLSTKLSFGFVEHLLALPFAFFQRHSDGDLLMRLRATNQIREVLSGHATRTILDGVFAIIFLVILTVASPVFAIGTMVAVGIVSVPYVLVRRENQRLHREQVAARAASESFEVELLRASETVKAMGLERDVLEHWANLYVEAMNKDIRRERYLTWVDTPQIVFGSLLGLFTLMLGTALVLRGGLQVGEMLALASISGFAVSRLSNLVDAVQSFDGIKHLVELVDDVMENEREQPEPRPHLRAVNGAVRATSVSFRFSSSSPLVIDGVSLDIPAGGFAAIVGPSGSGKSTLLKILDGLYLPDGGDIEIDGANLRAIDLRSYRSRIAMVTQETQLFARSIRWNISLGLPQVSLLQVEQAAKLAEIHDDIMAMPMGYETVLADQGRSLSGGQRQRLALARAFVRKPKLLLLDEATSAMDVRIEASISSNIEALGCTRIVVAHRIGTVRRASVIFVMDAGKIVETGTHDELMAKGGLYATLAR